MKILIPTDSLHCTRYRRPLEQQSVRNQDKPPHIILQLKNGKSTEQEKRNESHVRGVQGYIQRQTHQNNFRLHYRNPGAQKAIKQCTSSPKRKQYQSRWLYPAKLPFKTEEIKTFKGKNKLKKFMTSMPALQKILTEILCTERKQRCTIENQERIKHQKNSKMQKLVPPFL